jgi:ATP-dependent protease ClpP protease subunit
VRVKNRLCVNSIDLDSRPAIPEAATDGGEPVKWWTIENKDDGPAKVYLYDSIGGFWGVPASEFIADLNAIDAKQIDLHVNSPGGAVFDGLAIMNALAAHPAEVTAHIDGLAASAASFLVQSADKVIMERQSQMMIHDAQSICVGNAADMMAEAELLDSISDAIADVYSEATGTTRVAWRERMRAETWYSADEAVEAGLADECAPKRSPRSGGESNRLADTTASSMHAHWIMSRFRYPDGRASAPAPTGVAAQSPELVTVPPAASGPEPRFSADDLRAVLEGASSNAPVVDVDWRSVLASAAYNAPAPHVPAAPEPAAPPAPTPNPEPVDAEPDLGLQHALFAAASHAAAPPEPAATLPSSRQDDPVLTRSDMINALREAIR